MLSPVTNNNKMEIVQVKAVLDAAALVYAPEEHGLLLPAAFYRARDGVAHQVCVNLHPEVGWRVIDLAATFVARLEGADDLRPSASACARDYARQCQTVPCRSQGEPADPAPGEGALGRPRGRRAGRNRRRLRRPTFEHRPGSARMRLDRRGSSLHCPAEITDLRFPLACDPWLERAVRRCPLRSSSGSGRGRRSRP